MRRIAALTSGINSHGPSTWPHASQRERPSSTGCPIGSRRISGFPAWVVWILIHILYLIEFESKILVMIQWAWSYVTRDAGARLITPDTPIPHHDRLIPPLDDGSGRAGGVSDISGWDVGDALAGKSSGKLEEARLGGGLMGAKLRAGSLHGFKSDH